MKKYLSIMLLVFLNISVVTGCNKQNNTVQNGMSAAGPLDSTQELINDFPDNAFSSEDYQKLLALQIDGYEDMSISTFQNQIWKLTDSMEYKGLIEKFSKSEMLYNVKDSNKIASFLFHVLEPLAAEKWQSKTYNGYSTTDFPYPSENAALEYSITLTILNPDTLTVREYDTLRFHVIDDIQNMLNKQTVEVLQNAASMELIIETEIDTLIKKYQTDEIEISIEYAYFPLPAENEDLLHVEEDEKRVYANGTEEDYRSLLALKTPDFQNMPLAVFNDTLLRWANDDYERMERVGEDTAWNDFQVRLSDEELSFVKVTVLLSGIENTKSIQSDYTKEIEENRVYVDALPQKVIDNHGKGAWCKLTYQFTYHVSDRNVVSVGERDHQIAGTINAIKTFWENTDIETMLKMNESDIIEKLEKIAATYSSDEITIKINKKKVHFEKIDERANLNEPCL